MVSIVFYQDPEPEDCDVFAVYATRQNAVEDLKKQGWTFNTDYCVWNHKDARGFVEIFERELL